MNDALLDHLAKDTALDILQRHAPDCARRQSLIDAIARLARQAIDGHVRLYQTLHQQQPAD